MKMAGNELIIASERRSVLVCIDEFCIWNLIFCFQKIKFVNCRPRRPRRSSTGHRRRGEMSIRAHFISFYQNRPQRAAFWFCVSLNAIIVVCGNYNAMQPICHTFTVYRSFAYLSMCIILLWTADGALLYIVISLSWNFRFDYHFACGSATVRAVAAEWNQTNYIVDAFASAPMCIAKHSKMLTCDRNNNNNACHSSHLPCIVGSRVMDAVIAALMVMHFLHSCDGMCRHLSLQGHLSLISFSCARPHNIFRPFPQSIHERGSFGDRSMVELVELSRRREIK